MQVLCSLLVALVYCSFANAGETLEVVAGEPFILNFGYSGPKVGISSDLTKDGEKVTVDNIRTFMQLDNLYFAEIDELDSGEYHFTVTGDGVNFEKTIVVSVTKNTDFKSPEFYTPELAILKAIAEEQKEIVKRNPEVEAFLPITNNAPIHYRRSTASTIKHGDARATVERILTRARKQTPDPFPVDPFLPMFQFAQCIQPPTPGDCSVYVYRTIDGTCNNMDNPMWGSVNRAFRRLLPSEYEDGVYVPTGAGQLAEGNLFGGPWPSPRLISRTIITDVNVNNPGLSMFFTVFGQAIALDNTRFGMFPPPTCPSSCDDFAEILPFCYPFPVQEDDPTYGVGTPNNGTCRQFIRAIGQCMMPFDDNDATYTVSREQINELTHYLDASGMYGSTAEENAMVRAMTGGRLKQSAVTETYKGDLPLVADLPPDQRPANPPPIVLFAGDIRTENYVHQIVMYTLLYRMHNAIVDSLAEINPCWDDERLFQEGRKIVGGIWQAIIYQEYVPLLFGDQFNTYVGDYTGYNTSVDATVPIAFAVGAGRFGHSMFDDPTARLDSDGNMIAAGPLSLRDAFFNASLYYAGGGVDPLTRGMLADESRELDQFLVTALTNQLFPFGASFGDDLAAFNIQRGRDHGMPSYRTWQRYCYDRYGVNATYGDGIEDQLRNVYGDGFADGIDLWVGGLMEDSLSASTPLGPTFACLIGQTYRDLRAGDRFYWQNPGVFTDEQRASIAQMTVARLICANADNINTIRRAAFTLGGETVSCDDLPYVDLTLWEQDNCTAPTTMPPTTAGPTSGASTTCSLSIVYLFMAIVPFLFALF